MTSSDDKLAKIIRDPRLDGSIAQAISRVRDSERRLRALVQATSTIVYRMSPDWTVLHQLDGHGSLVDTFIPSQDWRDEYLLSEDRHDVDAAIEQAIATKSIFDIEHRVRRADRSHGWVHSRAVPILDDAGNIEEWFGAATDITDRRAAEQAFRDQFVELEQVYATAPVGLALFSADLVFQRVNERLAEMNGIPASDHIGRKLADLVPSLLEQVEAICAGFEAGGGPVRKLLSGVTAAQPGVVRNWEEYWSPVRDERGGLKALSVVVEEITERKVVDKALAESEERLRLAASAAGLGTWDFDLIEGRGVWDEAAVDILGLHDVNAAYDASEWLLPVSSLDHDRLKSAYRASAETGGRPFRVEFRGAVPASDGGERWLAASGTILRGDGGEPRRAIGFVQDITSQRRREEQLAASEARFRASQEVAAYAFAILCAVRDASGAVIDFVWEYANPAAHRVLGMGDKPIAGTSLHAKLPADKDHPLLFPRYVRALETGVGDEVELFYRSDDTEGWFLNTLTVVDADRVGIAFRNISERKAREASRQMLVHELNHRVKNILALVQAVARRTFDRVADAEALKSYDGRLAALAASNDLLAAEDWQRAELSEVVARVCASHTPERFRFDGPKVHLGTSASMHLAMALHELCTNATKYGALSNEAGRVSLDWSAKEGLLEMIWRESGGPPVKSPVQPGFGTMMIRTVIDGEADLRFEPDGLVCLLKMPVEDGGML